MAFSIRNIISTIPYFKKSEDEDSPDASPDKITSKRLRNSSDSGEEPNSKNPKTPSDTKHAIYTPDNNVTDDSYSFQNKKSHLSNKILKLDIEKANIAQKDKVLSGDYKYNAGQNTPQQNKLESSYVDVFSEKLKEFDLSQSFDVYDLMDDKIEEDIESLSDSESISSQSNEVKMCRKVQLECQALNNEIRKASSSSESFTDIDIEREEYQRLHMVYSYQMQVDKMEQQLQKMFKDLQFHIEVSKLFQTRSALTPVPKNDSNAPKSIGDYIYSEDDSRSNTPTGSWNIIGDKEDTLTKCKIKRQLLSVKDTIEDFVQKYLYENEKNSQNLIQKRLQKRLRVNKKKSERRIYDFPDLNDALQNLFSLEPKSDFNVVPTSEIDILNSSSENDFGKCNCKCRHHRESSPSQTDSAIVKTNDDKSDQSITSSIGNFSLDSMSLSAYSESLENIISYNSFNDSSLYTTVLQKAAIERITFYVQVHSIQLKSVSNESDNESKPSFTFNCHSCNVNEENEHDLLKHILSQGHCEKIHFLYKTAYIQKCFKFNKEVQPSTVLNPMTMYRDDNKIVCFGDGLYACSLCFENMIVGESVLMAHCNSSEHIDRREFLQNVKIDD